MQSVESGTAERAEVEALLNSGALSRAPNLTRILRYCCERYFDGEGEQIKEYNVAVEALGRPADFDQKKDSIVRVEAHKLRKRLKEFYESEGATHTIRIEIPNGQYAPVFVWKDSVSRQPEPEAAAEVVESGGGRVSGAAEAERPAKMFGFWVAAATAIATFGIALSVVLQVEKAGAIESWKGSPAEAPSDFRTLAGYHGPPFHDRQGRTWEPDAFFTGGKSVPIASGLRFECLPDPHFVHAVREGDFHYDVPVRAGTYEVHLYFLNPVPSKTSRNDAADENGTSFQIEANGKPLVPNLDVLSEAGEPNRLHERVFRDIARDRDGKIHLGFHPISGAASLTAMEILADAPGHVRPIRIVARKSSLIDTDGTVWSADEYVTGGRLVERKDSVRETPDKTLYEGERFGNFTYHIPVAPGHYQLALYFAETYFGTRLPFSYRDYGNGARIFNVFVNGEAVLRNFDVAEAAGGANRGMRRVFSDVQPNAQGKIVIEFNAVRNYAEVNALELVGMDGVGEPAKLTVR